MCAKNKASYKVSNQKPVTGFNCIVKPGVIHGFKSEGVYCEAYPNLINNECHVSKEVDGKLIVDVTLKLDDVFLLPHSGRRDKYGKQLVADDIVAVNVAAGSKEWIFGRLMYRGGEWEVGLTEYFNSIIISKFPIYSEHMVVKIGNIFDESNLVSLLNGLKIEVQYDDEFNACGIKDVSTHSRQKKLPVPEWLEKFDKILSWM